MLLLARLRLSSEMLGIKKSPIRGGYIRRFERLADGRLKTPLAIWDWALRESFANFGWRDKVDWSAVRPDVAFHSGRIDLFTRHWNKGTERMHEEFESVFAQQEVTQALILSRGPDSIGARKGGHARMPDPDELRDALLFIGRFLGVSPWGNRFGYGRFDQVTLTQVTLDEYSPNLGRHGIDDSPLPPGIAEDPDDPREVAGWLARDDQALPGGVGAEGTRRVSDVPGILEDDPGEVPGTGMAGHD